LIIFCLIILNVFSNHQGTYLQSCIPTVLAAAPVIIAELPVRLRRLAFLPLIRWLPQERLRLTLPVAVILTLLLNPLWVFCFGIFKIPLRTYLKQSKDFKLLQDNLPETIGKI